MRVAQVGLDAGLVIERQFRRRRGLDYQKVSNR